MRVGISLVLVAGMAVVAGVAGLVVLSGRVGGPGRQSAMAPVVAAKPAAEKADDKPQIYDEKADGRELVKAALVRAKKDNHNVLIQWGGNWCGWCVALHGLYEKNEDIKKELLYEYELVMIDTNERNMPLAKELGAELAGVPYLTVLDANGKPLVQQETDSLEVKGKDGNSVGVSAGHDAAKVLAFLKAHEPAHVKAADALAKGLVEAKATDRLAFVHFGAPWCGWCRRLEAWMGQPEVEALLAKDYVDIKIDEDRMEGGQELATKMGATGGIPWFAIVDAAGKTLVTSASTGENIGYPGHADEIKIFLGMLKTTAHRTTDADLDLLKRSLEETAKKLGI